MLERFEHMVEQAVEGSLRRIFPTHLQPVQLAKAAARAMEESQVVGPWGPQVPNLYVVSLAPDDMQRFVAYQATLCRELARYLLDYAADRGLRPVAEPRVELRASERVRTGTARAEAHFVDLEPERQEALEDALEGTRALRLARGSPARDRRSQAAPSVWWLVDEAGREYRLDPELAIVRLGRALDNDVVIADSRVSRYHAQLQWTGRGWEVTDLGSTNGTVVGKRQVAGEPLPLRPGTDLLLGQVPLAIRAGAEAEAPLVGA